MAGYWFFGCVGTYLIGILPLHYISVIPIQLRSRNVVCAHLAVFGHEIIIGTVSVGIALQILSSYVGKSTVVSETGYTSCQITISKLVIHK